MISDTFRDSVEKIHTAKEHDQIKSAVITAMATIGVSSAVNIAVGVTVLSATERTRNIFLTQYFGRDADCLQSRFPMRPVKFVQIKFLVLHKVCIDRHQFNPYFAESTLTGTAPAMLVYQPNKSGEKFWREIFCKIQTGLQPVAENCPAIN